MPFQRPAFDDAAFARFAPHCADCAAVVTLPGLGAEALRALRAGLAAGDRKVVCGGCLRGGPAVVRVVSSPTFNLGEVAC